MRALTVLAVILTLLMIGLPAQAAERFLAPDGDDAAAGSREAPWQTLAKASEAAQPGDIVILLPGEYPGQLAPTVSGTAEAPIVFRSEPRLAARLIGTGDESHAVVLRDLSHVRLEGLHVRPDPSDGRWILMQDCSQIAIEDCRMEDATGSMPMHFERSEQIQMRNCVVQRYKGHNMFRVSHCTRTLFEGNSISRTGHSPMQLYPDSSNRFMVLRGNVFHSAWGRPFEHFGTHDVLFENNIVTNAFNGGRSASSNAKFATTRGIFRFNRVFRNPHSPINLYPFRDVWVRNLRIYHNVFDDNGGRGIGVISSRDQVQDVLFLNNIFSRNDRHGADLQLTLGGGDAGQVRIVSNVITASDPGATVLRDYGEQLTVRAMQEAHPERYVGNMDVSPGYVDPSGYNHALAADSPLRDAARHLAFAVGDGEGALIEVTDATCFYDGYGIDGEQGDLIAIGSPDQRARVLEVDHEASTLRLDRDVQWQDGDPVNLPWSGARPDIGVYEYGPNARPSVQVMVEPFEARPGEQVTIRAVCRGELQPETVRWHLGDGTVAEGLQVAHSYAEVYDYPIRVRVTGADGDVHHATGYVVVAEARDPSEPLVHTTWEAGDERAWWLWKSYRPFPARYEQRVDDETGRAYRHIYAPEDGGRLPAQIHPRDWDIDAYPRVFIRYRIGEGVPVAVTLRAFAGPGGVVAASPSAQVAEDERLVDNVLVDDEQWHEIEIDVRAIRDVNPGVAMLEGMRIGAAPADAVDEGDWYDLDEVIIGPATAD